MLKKTFPNDPAPATKTIMCIYCAYLTIYNWYEGENFTLFFIYSLFIILIYIQLPTKIFPTKFRNKII